MTMGKIVVLDIGGSFVKSALMSLDGEIHAEDKIATPPSGKGEIFDCIRHVFNDYAKDEENIRGLALSVPGAVEVESGYVSYAGAVLDIIGKNIKEELADLKVPIELENDANCAALAEKWQGNARHCDNFLCVTIGTGVGGAIFNRGEIVRGVEGMAGEFGLMMLDARADIPTLLSKRTFSRYASTYNLVDHLNDSFKERKTGEEWFARYDAGDAEVTGLIHMFYDRLSIGIINLMHILAPEKIVIGGGISDRPELITYIKEQIKTVPTAIAEKIKIEACKHRNQAGLIGALYHFKQMQDSEE